MLGKSLLSGQDKQILKTMTLESNEHTHTHKVKNSWSVNLQYVSEVAEALSYNQNFNSVRVSSEICWPISTKFHVSPIVETGLRVCSNGHTPLTVMPIYGKIMK